MPERVGTKVVRGGRVLPDGAGTPVTTPLVQSVAFDHASMAEQDAVFGGGTPGYVYGRYGTPTTAALEAALADLEGLPAAACFVSGMSAIHALVTSCRGALVVQEDCYGGTRALLERMRAEDGRDVTFVDATDVSAVRRALRPGALLHVEAISNPFLRVVDVAALAAAAREAGATLSVDATFATPVLMRPAALGAGVVVHSLTKYINGHGDVMGGVVAGSDELVRALRDRIQLDGAYLPPHEAWLCLRGMRTLDVRMRRQCESASALAARLVRHPKVARVRYPGLSDHPQHALAKARFGGLFGAVVSVTLRDDTRPAAHRFLDALELAASASTVGDLYTEVLYPAGASHRRLDAAERQRLGITDGLVRISVGIEDPGDIAADVERALDAV
ncbi:MAG TPA: PLP-dependent transferase [Candidatus Limnocylindria bacterium]|nr:PLP-dependent transferase [Candidatus Limnocylindria bacterium]